MAVVKAVHDHEGEVTGLVQPTQIHEEQAPAASKDATLLLGIEGLTARPVELVEDGGRVVHVATEDLT